MWYFGIPLGLSKYQMLTLSKQFFFRFVDVADHWWHQLQAYSEAPINKSSSKASTEHCATRSAEMLAIKV